MRAASHHSALVAVGAAPLRSAPRRHSLNEAGQSLPKKKFKDHPIGNLRVDFAEVQTEEGKQYLFVAIDRTSKAAFAELHPRAKRVVAAEFLRRVLGKLPYRVHTALTDNGVRFTPQPISFCPAGTALPASAENTAWRTASPSRPTPGPRAGSSA